MEKKIVGSDDNKDLVYTGTIHVFKNYTIFFFVQLLAVAPHASFKNHHERRNRSFNCVLCSSLVSGYFT